MTFVDQTQEVLDNLLKLKTEMELNPSEFKVEALPAMEKAVEYVQQVLATQKQLLASHS